MDLMHFNQRYKEVLHDTFKFAIRFFESHNLSWFCAFGTALGAVRHNDIIPWDDDIDIYLPREDYEKLLSLKDDFKETGYTVVSYKDDGYCFPFAKIVDENTTLWEAPRYSFVLGVYIDIFPLDYSELSGKKYESAVKSFSRCSNKFLKCQTSYSLTEFKYDLLNNYKGAILTGIMSMFYPKSLSIKAREEFAKKEKQFYNKNGKNCVSFSGFYGSKEIYNRAWFDNYQELPFHDYKVRVPIGYDNYLKQIYGDYMVLPPEDKRVTHHGHYYLNLNERLDIDKIKKRVKKGERLVY